MYVNCFSYTMRLNGEQWIKNAKSLPLLRFVPQMHIFAMTPKSVIRSMQMNLQKIILIPSYLCNSQIIDN